MRTDSLIALKIGPDASSAFAASLKPILGRAAAVIGSALSAIEGDRVRVELASRLQRFQSTIDESTDLAALMGSCFDL